MRAVNGLAVAVLACSTAAASAGTVLVLTDFAGAKVDVVNDLGAISGVTVVEVGGATSLGAFTLGNYSQVWDLRVTTFFALNATLSGADQAAYAQYLQGGGRLLLAGEYHDNGWQSARNASIEAFIDANGGDISLSQVLGGNSGLTTQTVTGAAAGVGFDPRTGVGVTFSNSEYVTSVGNGFYITSDATGYGSVVGWDFGDITDAANARMIAYFDSDLRRGIGGGLINDSDWIEDMWRFLDGGPGVIIPLPSAGGMALAGLAMIGMRRRR